MKIVTFSGIDGAGKSTQIASLKSCLGDEGIRVASLTFWDDVAVLSRFREFMSYKAFRGDLGIGTPEKPLHRRDKNVTSWPVTVARFVLYLADSFKLQMVVKRVARKGVDVVIFDRYIYDELANLPLDSWFARGFTRLLLSVAPKPDSAFLIDADPKAARARKPEYPLEFLVRNRQSYLRLSRMTGDMTIIEHLSIRAAAAKMKEIALAMLGRPEQCAALPLHCEALSGK
jgi:thymidylate kinase